MVQTGLVPTKIATFGIELEQPNRHALLLLIALVNIYFLIAFVIYAASDYRSWRAVVDAARKRSLEAQIFEAMGQQYGLSGEAAKKRYEEGSLDGERYERLASELQARLHNAYLEEDAARRGGQPLEEFGASLVKASDAEVTRFDDVEASLTDRSIGFLMIFFQLVLPILVGIYGTYTLLSQVLTP
jgi:hypothetical protein